MSIPFITIGTFLVAMTITDRALARLDNGKPMSDVNGAGLAAIVPAEGNKMLDVTLTGYAKEPGGDGDNKAAGKGTDMGLGDVVFFASGKDTLEPLLVIYADGRLVTSGAVLPDDGARQMLDALKHRMRSAYQDLKTMDAALAVLDDELAPAAAKDLAKVAVKNIRAAWAKKFAATPVGPQPEDTPVSPRKP